MDIKKKYSLWGVCSIGLVACVVFRTILTIDDEKSRLTMFYFFIFHQIIDGIILYTFPSVSATPRATLIHHFMMSVYCVLAILTPQVQELGVYSLLIDLNAWFYHLRRLLHPWEPIFVTFAYYTAVFLCRHVLALYLTYRLMLQFWDGFLIQICVVVGFYFNILYTWWLAILLKNRLSRKQNLP